VDEFDVNLNLGLCRAQTEQLPLLKLNAQLPELSSKVDAGKITSLLLIVDSLLKLSEITDDPNETEADVSLDKLIEEVALVFIDFHFFPLKSLQTFLTRIYTGRTRGIRTTNCHKANAS
jgi:hypothetical protein